MSHMLAIGSICDYHCEMNTTELKAVTNLFRAHAALEEQFSGELNNVHGLALKEMILLMFLENSSLQRLSRVDLSKRMHSSASTVTRLAAPLEKRGLVKRESDNRDARLSYVVLTRAGQELVGEARTSLQFFSVDVFSDRWSKKEIETIAELLGRLTSGLPGKL